MTYSPDTWIPLALCQDGYLYSIQARNAYIGVYKTVNKSFTIRRVKFTSTFLFDEYHWETGSPYGTVKPFRILEKAPEFKDDEEKLAWLTEKEKAYPDERIWNFK
jgi:hypothetical protein